MLVQVELVTKGMKDYVIPRFTERCLFFMLGEQGFNTNADNYWDGWEPIRAILKVNVIRWAGIYKP